jgi:hypothetical protein
MSQTSDHTTESQDSLAGLAVRLVWLLGASVGLILTAAYIFRSGEGPFTVVDAIYWAIVALAIGARWLDIERFRGTTTQGRRATRADGRRYSLTLGLVALAAWVVAHLL